MGKKIDIYDKFKELEQWQEKIDIQKAMYANELFRAGSLGIITRYEAMKLMTKYELLPVHPWINLPHYAEDDDYLDRYSTVYYADLLWKDNFNDVKGQYIRFDMPFRKAVMETWRFMKKKRLIGCKIDW